MEIKLLRREDIDDKRWNGCVHFAINAVPYAYTWYLDNICETWEGLVMGNYKMVMPLVIGKKFGFNYLYQPFFAQQHGIFAEQTISQEVIELFIEKIPEKYKYIDIHLNGSHNAPDGFEKEKRVNYLLDLTPEYEVIRGKYSGNMLRNLKKAEKSNLRYSNQIKPEVFTDFYMLHTAPKVPNFDSKYQHTILRLIYKTMFYSMGAPVGVYEGEQLVATNFLIHHPQRSINLLPSSSARGNEVGAMAYLMDTVIRIGAGNRKYLDFEGSMLPGVAKFYEGFGAEKSHYYRVKRNNLPWFARIFKD